MKTGIYKKPVSGIMLGRTDVQHDAVVDRTYHGGEDKACYAFALDQYDVWKPDYPELEWEYGMFGENITIDGLDERTLYIGERFSVGDAELEVSEPREPCYKLGVRFGTQKILKPFLNQPHCGVYFKVIKEGMVQAGDVLYKIDGEASPFTIARVYWLMFHASEKDINEIEAALQHTKITKSIKGALQKRKTLLTKSV